MKILLIIIFFIPLTLFSQDNEKIGLSDDFKFGSYFYNYGDKNKVNIEVIMWGSVKAPGKYLVPQGTSVLDLISLGGGPNNDANIGNIRIVRLKNDTLGIKEDKVIILNYDEYLWENKIIRPGKANPILLPGDMVFIPNEPRFFLRDNLYLILSIASTLVSLTTFVITVIRN